jgi:predicted DNA-binding transcriptional regulator AlpA
MSQDKTDALISGPNLRKRQDVSEMTIWRRKKDKALNFPQPIKISGRNFFRLSEIEEWERRMAARPFESIGDVAGRVVGKLKGESDG